MTDWSLARLSRLEETLVGTDACPTGWMAAVQLPDGSIDVRIVLNPSDIEVLEPAIVAIDIPIGLSESGFRTCDSEAKKLLGSRSSSVFMTPPAASCDCETYPSANELCRLTTGKGMSRQAFALIRRICAVETHLMSVRDPHRWLEVHPELCFTAMAGSPCRHSKHKPEGLEERRALVESQFPGAYKKARAKFTKGQAADHDILDAFAALYTAKRVLAGKAEQIPKELEFGRHGLPSRMVF